MGTFKPKEDRPAVEAHFSCVAPLLCVLPLDTNNESLFIGVIGVGMFEAFDRTPLDMDVIDTSWMDSNVQALRHSYFNVNRWLIDDIREIITTKRRARQRTGPSPSTFSESPPP